jgi:adenosylcobyric acid synthase
MVCGTASNSGKSTVVAGLCRLLARRGVRVAPFKAQNMALNSAVTPHGHEIGRAQAAQAQAAGVPAEVAMNPVLLKPQSDRTSQVIVMGRPWQTLDAADYQRAKPSLLDLVLEQLAGLRARFDVVLCEGAGSPAEINLLDDDIVNLRIARDAGLPAIVVGDIDRGGVFAALFGTVELLPENLRATIGGFVINKLRGDPTLLAGGPEELGRRTGIPTLGVLPWLPGLGLDAEDSLALSAGWPAAGADGSARPGRGQALDVAVVRFPRISNFTDLDPLAVEPGVSLRLVDSGGALGRPDLLILPGSKSTVADLDWLHQRGLAAAITALARGTTILGICGGYQMLGRRIDDPVESDPPRAVRALGLLPVDTVFGASKVTCWTTGRALGEPVTGYQIHHGLTESADGWISGPEGTEGCRSASGQVLGTNLHGLFEADGFRVAFLAAVADRVGRTWAPSGVSFALARQAQFDRVADALEEHVDLGAVERLIGQARPTAATAQAARA